MSHDRVQLYTSLLRGKDRDLGLLRQHAQQLRQQATNLQDQVDGLRDQLQTLQALLVADGVSAGAVDHAVAGRRARKTFDLAVIKQRLTQVPWPQMMAWLADPAVLVWNVFAWTVELDRLHPRTSPLFWCGPDTFKVYAPPPTPPTPAGSLASPPPTGAGTGTGPWGWRAINWLDIMGPIIRTCDDAVTSMTAGSGGGGAGTKGLRETNRTLLTQLQRTLDEHLERRGLVDKISVEQWEAPVPNDP